MSDTLELIKRLVASGQVRVSEHGYDEMSEDGISVRDVLEALQVAEAVEDYPDFPKGPTVLVLEFDRDAQPVHVVWGIPRGHRSPAVVVTAYRPDPTKWSSDFRRRRR